MPAPIFVTGPGRLLPGEREKSEAATAALRLTLRPIAEQFGGIAAANALMSVWLDVHLTLLGLDETETALRLLRRDLPRMMAAIHASKTEPEGRA